MPFPFAAAATLASAGLSYFGADKANKETAKRLTSQMDFQREMSNTSHQREVQDLRAAGLNPILSAKYGGASTPSGASAPATDTLSGAVSSAQAAARLGAEIKNMREVNKNLQAQNKNVNADTAKKYMETAIAKENLQSAKAAAARDEVIENIYRAAPESAAVQWLFKNLGINASTAKQYIPSRSRAKKSGSDKPTLSERAMSGRDRSLHYKLRRKFGN